MIKELPRVDQLDNSTEIFLHTKNKTDSRIISVSTHHRMLPAFIFPPGPSNFSQLQVPGQWNTQVSTIAGGDGTWRCQLRGNLVSNLGHRWIWAMTNNPHQQVYSHNGMTGWEMSTGGSQILAVTLRRLGDDRVSQNYIGTNYFGNLLPCQGKIHTATCISR